MIRHICYAHINWNRNPKKKRLAMLALISPAKKLDFETAPTCQDHSIPNLIDDAKKLISSARKLSRSKLAKTMQLSEKLADLNFRRFQDFSTPFHLGNAKQAALVFNGDTYVSLQANSLNTGDMEYAQKHLRILSGLYGILRPLDLIQPYRLEMGARFSTPYSTNLYEFWGNRITDSINSTLERHENKTLINLASTEYFKAVNPKALKGSIITPVFKEIKNGETRTIGMFAKRARGAMARFIIINRVDNLEGLKDFNANGYEYQNNLSDEKKLVFSRIQPCQNS